MNAALHYTASEFVGDICVKFILSLKNSLKGKYGLNQIMVNGDILHGIFTVLKSYFVSISSNPYAENQLF